MSKGLYAVAGVCVHAVSHVQTVCQLTGTVKCIVREHGEIVRKHVYVPLEGVVIMFVDLHSTSQAMSGKGGRRGCTSTMS